MMTEQPNHSLGLVFISLLTALLLQVLPLPAWSNSFRPDWILLVVLCWIMLMPWRINVGIAWLMGFILDGLSGSLLGEHALALLIPAFIMSHWQRRFFLFPVWQQALLIGVMEGIYKLTILVIQGAIGQPPVGAEYWFSIGTTILLWPWIQAVLTVQQARKAART